MSLESNKKQNTIKKHNANNYRNNSVKTLQIYLK